MIFLIIIAVLAIIIVGIVAYERGLANGFKESREIFNRVFNSNLQRWEYYKTEPTDLTDTDEQQDQNE